MSKDASAADGPGPGASPTPSTGEVPAVALSARPSAEAAGGGWDRVDESPLWLLILVMGIVVSPLIVLSQVIAWWRFDVVDDQMFAYYGWRIAHGATVYLDVWDNKPPGIYWINAVGMLLSGGSYLGIIALCVVALVAAHVAFFVAAASVYHRGAAALTTILLSFFLTHAYYTGGTNRTETFLVACELTAVALYFRGWARDRWWTWLLAGALCGVAFLFKQVGLAAWGAMLVHLLSRVALHHLPRPRGKAEPHPTIPMRAALRRAGLLVAGTVLTLALAAGYLAGQGALAEAWFATFTFNRLYFGAGVSRFPYSFVSWTMLRDHVKPILLMPLLMGLAAALHTTLWWLRPQHRPPEIEQPLRAAGRVCEGSFLLFLLWFLAASYGALLSPHGFRHYLVPVIPPLLLMCGHLINVLRAESRLLVRVQRRAWVLVGFVLIAYFSYESVRRQFEEVSKIWTFRIDPWLLARGWYPAGTSGVGRYEPAEWEVVGDAVARHTGPADRIHCFGYLPGVYLRARRINACRFTTTEKPGQIGAGADFILREVDETLRARPPVVLVINHDDYLEMHGIARGRRVTPWLIGPWVNENYRLVEEIPRFPTVYIFKRSDLVPETEALAAPALPASGN